MNGLCPTDCQYRLGGECDGSMCMPKPVEVLNDADLERGKSPLMKVVDEPMSNGGW